MVMAEKFVDSELGRSWMLALQDTIGFVDSSIERWDKLKATVYDIPLVPPEVEQWFASYREFLPNWIVEIKDLAGYFYIPEDPFFVGLGRQLSNELKFILGQLTSLPKIYFEDPNYTLPPPPELDPNNTDCQNLIEAINNLNIQAGASEETIRLIVKEELTLVSNEILKQGHDTRVEIANIAWRIIQNWNALHTHDSTREDPIATVDKHFALWEFPKVFPASLVDKYDSEGNKQDVKTKQVTNYLELSEWFFNVFEELIGQFPLGIKVIVEKNQVPVLDESGNPVIDADGKEVTEEELVTETIRLPNIAEALSEVFLLQFQSWENSERNIELGAKTLIESGSAKKIGTITDYRLKALEDYLGYNTEQDTIDIPMAFSVGAKDVKSLTAPSTIPVGIIKYVDNGLDFSDSLRSLVHSAEIIKGVFWQPLPQDAEGATVRFKETIQAEKAVQDEIDSKNIDDVDARIQEIENGLINKAGIDDSTKPYGLPIEHRPKITQIGITSEQI